MNKKEEGHPEKRKYKKQRLRGRNTSLELGSKSDVRGRRPKEEEWAMRWHRWAKDSTWHAKELVNICFWW
jgi:hypothetical protein